jgi:non-ribosomal peptide synthetase component F
MPTKLTVTRPHDFIEFQKSSILQGIHQRIEEQTRLYPAKVALKAADLSYTYSQLNGHANSVAHAILALTRGEPGTSRYLVTKHPRDDRWDVGSHESSQGVRPT